MTFVGWDRRFIWLWVCITLWRGVYLFIVPLELAPDESYYWDWSRILDWGYYSKPPMIAWLNAVSTTLGGAREWVVRMPAVILNSLGLMALYLFVRHLFDGRVAFWTSLVSVASPGPCALSLIMTIDAPLVFFWTLALGSVWLALQKPEAMRGWLLSGVWVGLGILSKQMMLVFPLLVFLFLWTGREDRLLLRRRGPYVFAVTGLLGLVPQLYWNSRMGWMTLRHTGHHFEGHHQGGLYFLRTLGDFLGGQAGVVSPVVWCQVVTLLWVLAIGLGRLSREVRFLWVFSAPGLAMITALSLRQRIQPNWPAVFYVSALVLLCAWGCGRLPAMPRIDWGRRLFRPGIAVGAILAVMTYAAPWILTWSGHDGSKWDPTARLRGWRQLGQTVSDTLQTLPLPEKTVVVSDQRQIVSQLAFYLPAQPRVYKWTHARGRVMSQYDLWPGPVDKHGWDVLLILGNGRPPSEALRSIFRSLTPLGTRKIVRGSAGYREVAFYHGQFLKRWPRQ